MLQNKVSSKRGKDFSNIDLKNCYPQVCVRAASRKMADTNLILQQRRKRGTMKKKIVSFMMAACLFAMALTGCSSTTEKAPDLEKLVVTYVTSPLNVPTIIEKEKGIFSSTFEDMGIPVSYAELTSGADQTQALASGDVSVLYAAGATSIILSAANGADIKVLNMYSRSPKAFCLYAQDSGITSPEDLRGKTIGGPAGTNLHELLVAYLATADMSIEDVNFVNMTIPEAKAALDGGSLDAALLAGATAYQAKQQGCHLVADGEGLINAIIAVAVTNQFYQSYPDVIQKLGQAQDEIASFMEENEAETLQIVADSLDLELPAVEEMYAYYDFSTELTESDKKGFQDTADFMYRSGMIDQEFDVDALFYE